MYIHNIFNIQTFQSKLTVQFLMHIDFNQNANVTDVIEFSCFFFCFSTHTRVLIVISIKIMQQKYIIMALYLCKM